MSAGGSYPGEDIARAGASAARPAGGLVSSVEEGSPAWDAGIRPGMRVISADGETLRDVIDWRWMASDYYVEVECAVAGGEVQAFALEREAGQDWGIEFSGLLFDDVKPCRNNCTFCFMRQLPRGMRRSLYVRDDDFRLSFLTGTFVTLTNLAPDDERRIVEQRISPLRVSLQASEHDVRRRLMGENAPHGIRALERLLAAGIEFHAQIVLVPQENDGEHLRASLEWAYARPGILNVGIVPLGYTRHQALFDRSFNDDDAARAVVELVESFQRRALAERGHAWAHVADEFYRNAFPDDLLEHLPDSARYGDFSLFEDGIGIIRSTVDDWQEAEAADLIAQAGHAAEDAAVVVCMVAGLAQRAFLDRLVERSRIGSWFSPLYVDNAYFGGNVDVTGLLTAHDIVPAVRACARANPHARFFVPEVVFNDDGLTLDDRTLADMETDAGCAIGVVSCSPLLYFAEIAAAIRSEE